MTSVRLKRLLGAFHFTGAFWYRFHLFGARVLPEWAMRVAMVAFTSFFFVCLGSVRRAIAANLDVVLGPTGWAGRLRRSARTVWNHAWCLTETYEGLAGRARPEATVEGAEHWRRALDDRRGFVLVTAHVGHWEVGSHLAGGLGERVVHVVREPEADPEAQRFLRGLIDRTTSGSYRVHFATGDDVTLGARLLAALRRGEVVALQGDRPRAGGRTVDVELFGRAMALPAGPAALARAAGVALLPIFVLREGRRRSRVVVRPPIEIDRRSEREVSVREATQRLAIEIEAAIRRRPDQWYCFRELWPKA